MDTEPPAPLTADLPGTASSPARVVPALSHGGNHRVLVDWIRQQERYEIVPDDHTGLPDAEFDIVMIDEHSLREHETQVRERKADAEAILPVLLVSADSSDSRSDTGAELVDEILTTPIETAELRSRLDTLTRIRAQSITLQRKTDQLLLLNRITRHDIQNEMNLVILWAEQLADHTDEAGDQIRERIVDSGRHVVDLTEVVRESIQALQTADEPELRAVSLDDVLTDELTKQRSNFDAAEFLVVGEMPRVDVCANDLLTSVFRNVLHNAVQHNDAPAPRVEVTVVERDGMITVTVADNGPGIPPDRRDAVLGRTDEGLDHPAAGLGFYLVDTLVGQYGGTLGIGESDAGGATVDIALPKTAPEPEEAADGA